MVEVPVTTVELLGRVPAFSTLSPDDLLRVSEVATSRRFAPGELVVREGEPGDTCYVVRCGHLRAVREHSDGRSITLATFSAGEIFGELAMFDDEHRSATVEAIEDSDVIVIQGPDMRALLRRHPEIAVKLLAGLGARLRETNDRLTRQSFATVQSRVATVLSQLVAATEQDASATGITITTTQADLGGLTGSSRESVSRFLAVLERAGVISQGRGRLTVHDPDALTRYVY